MSAIYWTGKKSYDADRMCHVLQAKIQDRSVAVRISEEAMEDRGEGATRAVAEEKIRVQIPGCIRQLRVAAEVSRRGCERGRAELRA